MNRALALAWATCACAVGPNYHRPPPPHAPRYTADEIHGTIAADGVAQTIVPGEQLAVVWWQLFGSASLDALVRTALANNPSLEAARASLRRSEYLLRAGAGVFAPQIDANAGASRQRFSPSRFGSTTPASEFNLYTLGGTVGYTLDVFGGERRTIEMLRAQVDVQCYSVAAARLAVTANVINTAIARAAYREEIAANEELVAAIKHQVEIARVQETAGTAAGAATLALETQLANTAATLPPLRQQLAAADHLLASLVGRTPAEWRAPPLPFAELTLPRELPVSLPSQLVRQRPDILIAESTLHASSANIGVATAAMLPNITLNGSAGYDSPTIEKIFSFSHLVWSLGANLVAPIFHGGTLNNQRKAAIEAYRQSLATYHQTVLAAFADVANALEALVHDAEAVDARSHALASATDAQKLVTANYEAGVAGYVDVLIANIQYEQARIGHISAQAQRLQDTVALFVALGGGWWQAEDNACSR